MATKTIEVFGKEVTKEGNAINSLRLDDLTVAELRECKEGLVQLCATVKGVEVISETEENVTYVCPEHEFTVRSNVNEVGSYQDKIGQSEEVYMFAELLGVAEDSPGTLLKLHLGLTPSSKTIIVARHQLMLMENVGHKGLIYSRSFLETGFGKEHQYLDKTVEERYARELPTVHNYDMYGRKLLDTKREN